MATIFNEECFVSRKSCLAVHSKCRYTQVQKVVFLLDLERLGSVWLAV